MAFHLPIFLPHYICKENYKAVTQGLVKMKKRKEVMDSGSSDDEESSKSSDEESKTSKKRNKSPHNTSDSGSDGKNVSKKARRMTRSSSSSDDSNDDVSDKEEEIPKNVPMAVAAPSHMQPPAPASDGNKSDLEEGQISSESEGSVDENDEEESSSNSEFDDGYGDDLMGNEIDRNQLEKLSEKERETELFKRAERRDQLKRRWEIERKLKQSRKVENAKNKTFKKPASKKPKTPAAKKMIEKLPKAAPYSSSIVEDAVSASSHLFSMPSSEEPVDPDKMDDEFREDYFDPKERSKERKKNVEMNKTDDKRSSAMAQLKAVSLLFTPSTCFS